MNTTVARIVEILFQDTEMNDEVKALQDEVLNNCQDRFEDMLARGLSEDEAIAAVVESLKGMEEVLADYPKKHPAEETDASTAAPKAEENDDAVAEADLAFDFADVQKIDVNVICDDVNFEHSDDGKVHVRYNKEYLPGMQVELARGCLKITRMNAKKPENSGRHIEIHSKDGTTTINGRSFNGQNISINLNSFGELMQSVGNLMHQATTSIRINMNGGSITIALPDAPHDIPTVMHRTSGDTYAFELPDGTMDLVCHTTSGDVNIGDVLLGNVRIETTSGDIELNQDEPLREVTIKTTSGDVDIDADCQSLTVQTMSGDMDVACSAHEMNLSTISGDVEARGGMEYVNAKTTSGDMTLEPTADRLHEIMARSISGDVRVQLPDELRQVTHIETKTVSGNVHKRGVGCDGAAQAQVRVQTTSGDITIE